MLEESEPSPGGAASSTRSSNDEHIDNVSSSPAVQREETEETHTTDDGLSQRRRSYGSDRSDPRRDARDESAVRADDEDAKKA